MKRIASFLTKNANPNTIPDKTIQRDDAVMINFLKKKNPNNIKKVIGTMFNEV